MFQKILRLMIALVILIQIENTSNLRAFNSCVRVLYALLQKPL